MQNKVTVTLKDGFVHGLIYVKELNQLWGCTRTSPDAVVMRFNPNNLAKYDRIVLSGIEKASDILYTRDYIYVCCKEHIIQINPETLSVTTVAKSDGALDWQSFCTDGTYLYVLGHAGSLRKYAMDTWAIESVVEELQDIDGSQYPLQNPHTIRYDVTYGHLYVTGANVPAWIAKVSHTVLVVKNVVYANYAGATDDLAMTDEYLWIGIEAFKGKILRVRKSDLMVKEIDTNIPSSRSYGTFYDGKHIWNLIPNIPGIIQRINPDTLEFFNITLDAGEDAVNEIASDGERLFLTCWTNPAKIISLNIPGFTNA